LNFLIVGDTSLVGQRLRARLSHKSNVLTAGRSGRADVFFDLVAPDPPSNVAQADILIHCAASFGSNEMDDAVHNEVVNGVGALRVAQLAFAAHCRHVIYISTLFIHDVPQNGYFGSYGLSKRHGQENLEWACRRTGMDFTALLPSQLYDEHGAARHHQPLLYHLIDCARQGRGITLYGSQDVERNFLFVDDLAALVEAVAEQRIVGVFTAAHPQSHCLSEVAALAFAAFGRAGRVRFDPRQPDLPEIYIPNDHTLYQRLHLWPKTDLAHGIALIRDAMGEAEPCENVEN
jgi:nucleoside-diphosphate-sugar epimerase